VRRLSPSDRQQEGFTLVELLVVLMLLGVVGSIVTAGLVSSMRSTSSTQARIEAMAELQRSAERVTRELRAACPVVSMDADGEDVTVLVPRDGQMRYHHFYRSGTSLMHLVADDMVEEPSGGRVLMSGLPEDFRDVFRFMDVNGGDVTQPRDVRQAEIRLRRELRDQPTVEVTTATTLRNGGGSCD
jgi:prepilin-type N-terminal cleavage/methylation domain-containing protein